MSSLQEALNQRKSRIETAISTKVSASGKKKSGVRRRSDPSSPSRKNTRLIGGHFPLEIVHQWHLLVAEEKINGATGQAPSSRGNQRPICEEGEESLTDTGVGIWRLRKDEVWPEKDRRIRKPSTALIRGTSGATTGYEADLWRMADTLRGSMDAAEYKHVVLGIIFLKYISDAFEERHILLESEREQGADPEDPDEYRAENIFWVPPPRPAGHISRPRQSNPPSANSSTMR